MTIRLLIPLFALLFALSLTACGGGNDPGQGTVQVSITDAPVDSAEAVVIHFISATLHSDTGNTTIDVTDPIDGTPGRSIDLLALQSGQWTGLFDDVVTAGHYSWIRLEMDFTKSYIQINGQQYGLRCNSCENNGYKLNSSFTVERDAVLALMLDFDLRKSITDPSNINTDYILRPTLRTIQTAASGSISGSVDSTLIASQGGVEGCSVYVFSGFDAMLDDVYIPFNMTLPAGAQNNPVSTAMVNGDGTYTYMVSFLPAGDYTAALTCNAGNDLADRDDMLDFIASANVSVIAGESTTLDFIAPPVPVPM